MSPCESRPFRRDLCYKFGVIGLVTKQKSSFHMAAGMESSPFSLFFLFLVFSASSQCNEYGIAIHCHVQDCGLSQTGKRSSDDTTNTTDFDIDRIIGGIPVTSQRKYPWIAWMGTSQYGFQCTSALINDRYILTAAHCVASDPYATYYVTLGSTTLFQWPAGQSIQIPATAIMHPSYNPQIFENDIALLKLHTPVNFAAYPNIRPICLAGFYPSPYSVVTIAGWGRPSRDSNDISYALMETAVYVMSLQTCQSDWGSHINNNYVCVKTAGRNTCQGDSGGSLMYRTSRGVYATVGVTSFGRDNCSPDVGSVFTSTSQCGVSQTGKRSADTEGGALDFDRVIGGTPVPSQKKYPWMAWMGTGQYNSLCGASLINSRYLITAAHCVARNPSGTYWVTLGSLYKFQWPAGQSYQVTATAIMHPQYNPTSIVNDIALLRLTTPVDFIKYPNIRPICTSALANPPTGSTATIIGWGITQENGNQGSSKLMEAPLTVISQSTCSGWWGGVTSKQICTLTPGRNTCNGDSGGPLMYRTSTGYYQHVGVVSYGSRGCLIKYGAVFTRTSSYMNDFIMKYATDGEWCPAP
ncbi:unnamed protein product [Darwinula stevensoni]|uniref:Peptidase S1 domain-containing protein n=1 Tax=Darwinula stevensoni TaxID=69355 RepID=A0A7R9A542_9CRUS|nr:unnamed protein product [Darwinula stevensoni]CAG0893648.1 unnamed protein product [Darwinula stevensoni]